MRQSYAEKLAAVKKYLTRAEIRRIEKLPRGSANRRLRRLNEIIAPSRKNGIFRPTKSRALKEALNPTTGLSGVFITLRKRKIKSVKVKKIGKRSYVEIRGKGVRAVVPRKYRKNIARADVETLAKANKGKTLAVFLNGRVLTRLKVDKRGRVVDDLGKRSAYAKNVLKYQPIVIMAEDDGSAWQSYMMEDEGGEE